MKIRLLSIFFLFNTIILFAQGDSKYDLRFGVGSTILGTGDLITTMVENEMNLKLNKFFTAAVSLGYGSSKSANRGAAFWQGNMNLFISPFRNNQIYDFRLGGGFTAYSINDYYRSFAEWRNGVLVDTEHTFNSRNAVGFNIIIENSIKLSEKILVGLKLFTQPYQNGDINSGLLLKFGLCI